MRTIRSRAEPERPLDPPEVPDADELEEAHEQALIVHNWFLSKDRNNICQVYDTILESFNYEFVAKMMNRFTWLIDGPEPMNEWQKKEIISECDNMVIEAILLNNPKGGR